jgi:hypothetical protein
MIWLLEKEIFENLDTLKQAIVEQGHEYREANYVPFNGGLRCDKFPKGKCFAYGSLQFGNYLRQNSVINVRYGGNFNVSLSHNAEVFCNLPQFKCSYYYPRLSKYLLNRECMFLPFGQLADASDYIFRKFGSANGTKIFMRPDSGFKQFTGQVYDLQYWENFLRLSNIALQPEDLVVISSPKEIFKEYRCIIGPANDDRDREQKVITLCQTHNCGKLDEQVIHSFYERTDIYKFVNKVLDDVCFEPDPFWVMDVCRDAFGELKVLEVNSMACSGYYKCDMGLIVKAVADYLKIYEN